MKFTIYSSLSLPLTMRALTHQLMKRPKKEPDPDGLGDYGNSNSGYSHYNNGNLENGNNGGVPAMDMDFHSQPPSLKVEPMDTYERNNGSPAHLNANRPQDAASIPGARSKTTPNTLAAQPLQPPKVPSIKVTKTADSSNRQDRIEQDRHHSHSKTGADRYTTKSDSKSSSLYKSNSNLREIKALKSKPSSGSGSGGTSTNSTTSSPTSSSASSKSQSGSSSVVSKTASKMGSDIKPSVSITPVSSADAATLNMKKPAGIEIIPLGDKLPENESSSKKSGSGSSSGSSDSKSSSLLKEIKRSLSEDDKRRMEKKDGKKRKRDQFILKNETSPSHKKSKQYSSSNSSSGGSGGSGTGSGSSGSTGSTTNKKLTSVIDR